LPHPSFLPAKGGKPRIPAPPSFSENKVRGEAALKPSSTAKNGCPILRFFQRRVGNHESPLRPLFRKTKSAAKPLQKQRRVGSRPSPGAFTRARITTSRLHITNPLPDKCEGDAVLAANAIGGHRDLCLRITPAVCGPNSHLTVSSATRRGQLHMAVIVNSARIGRRDGWSMHRT
jgi:hypothetical protein